MAQTREIVEEEGGVEIDPRPRTRH